MDALQRSLILQEKQTAPAHSELHAFGDYDNLSSRVAVVPNMFILPEYSQFSHIFKRVEPNVFKSLVNDEGLQQSAN